MYFNMVIEELLSLLDRLIDDRLENYGFDDTVLFLLDYGLTPEELIDVFRFNKKDVDRIIDEAAIKNEVESE